MIVAHHSLQMIRFDDLPRALAELRRVLKVGGVLRISVPDGGRAVEDYFNDDERFPIDPVVERTFAPARASNRGPILANLVHANDVLDVWTRLTFERKRSVIDILMVVTIEPETIRGARHFRPELIRIDWKSNCAAPR
jgi:SAM-dependent methyltransferase